MSKEIVKERLEGEGENDSQKDAPEPDAAYSKGKLPPDESSRKHDNTQQNTEAVIDEASPGKHKGGHERRKEIDYFGGGDCLEKGHAEESDEGNREHRHVAAAEETPVNGESKGNDVARELRKAGFLRLLGRHAPLALITENNATPIINIEMIAGIACEGITRRSIAPMMEPPRVRMESRGRRRRSIMFLP